MYVLFFKSQMIWKRFGATHYLFVLGGHINDAPHVVSPTPRAIDDVAVRLMSLLRDRADDVPLDVRTDGQLERRGVVLVHFRVAQCSAGSVRIDHDPQIPNMTR